MNMKVAARRAYRMTARARAAAATGERILSTATEVFLGRPYEQVSLDDVAREAGVTVQTVLRRFGSKEGLVAAAAEVGMERVRAERAGAPIGDLAGAVRNLVDHYEEWGARVLRMLGQEENVPPVRKVTDAGRQLHRAWVERTFAPWLRGSGAAPGAASGPAGRRHRRVRLEAAAAGSGSLAQRHREDPARASSAHHRSLLMARYLAYSTPARGHLYPIVPMLGELRRRGHTVVVRTLADEVDRMRGLGFAAAPIAAAIEARALDDWKAGSQTAKALAHAARTFIDRAQHEVPDLRAAIAAESPDALLIDVNAWGATGGGRGVGAALGAVLALLCAAPLEGRSTVRAGPRAARGHARQAARRDRAPRGPRRDRSPAPVAERDASARRSQADRRTWPSMRPWRPWFWH